MKFPLIVLSFALFISSVVAQDASVIDPRIIKIPHATMPKEAKESGLGGRVVVLVSIDETGNVTAAEDATGPDWVCPSVTRADVIALREAAKTAAMDAKFNPPTRNGQLVSSTMRLNFDFPRSKSKDKKELNYSASSNAPPADHEGTVATTRANNPPSLPKVISGHWLNHEEGVKPLPKPQYPPAARAVGASGAVNIQVVIDEEGKVFSAEAVSGHPLLRSAARSAACKAEFSPTLLSGQPVKIQGILTYNFVP